MGKLMCKWLDIETAPKDGTDIDVYGDYYRHTDCRWMENGGDPGWYKVIRYHEYTGFPIWEKIQDVTHWMPLPLPPKDAP